MEETRNEGNQEGTTERATGIFILESKANTGDPNFPSSLPRHSTPVEGGSHGLIGENPAAHCAFHKPEKTISHGTRHHDWLFLAF